MTKPKKPARKAAKKAPAQKKSVVPAETAAVIDWPVNLTETVADKLFDIIENGATVKKAAKTLGLKGNTVYRWNIRYARFAERLKEALLIGYDMMLDDYIDIGDTAKDRESAAAARERIGARREHLRAKEPARFNTSPFKPALPGEGDGFIVGVVIVPARDPNAGIPAPRPAIEGEASRVIERLPIDSTAAPAFKVQSDG